MFVEQNVLNVNFFTKINLSDSWKHLDILISILKAYKVNFKHFPENRNT